MLFIKIAFLLTIFKFGSSFQLGVRYIYEYKNKILAGNDTQGETSKTPSYQLLGKVHFTSIWESADTEEQLIKIELENPTLQILKRGTFQNQKSALGSYRSSPLYIYKVKSEITKTFCDENDDATFKSIKKGIASLLQYKPWKQEFSKEDGLCSVTYSLVDKLKKIRKECHTSELRKGDRHVQASHLLRVWQIEYNMHTEDSSIFQSASATEHMEIRSMFWAHMNVAVQSHMYLKLEKEFPEKSTIKASAVSAAIDSLKKVHNINFAEDSVSPLPIVRQSEEINCNLQKHVKSYRKYLKSEYLGKLTAISAYGKLLKCFQTASKKEIRNVLVNKEFKDILPQVLDIVAFTRTSAAFDAVFETLDFMKDNSDHLERYLLSLSLMSHPTRHMIKSFLNVLQKIDKSKSEGKMKDRDTTDEKVVASLIATLGAIAKKIMLYPSDDSNQQALKLVEDYFSNSVQHCDTEDCTLKYLRGLRNAALPSTVPLLIGFAEKGGKTTYEALLALKAVGFQDSLQCEKLCRKIFYQVGMKQETSNRVLAAEILLECYSNIDTLKQLLFHLTDQSDYELSTYVTSKVLEKMQKDPKLRSDIQHVLNDVKQYYAFSQKGLSVSFTNPLIPVVTASSAVNMTYGVQVQLIPPGVTKRCSVDINMHSPQGSFHVLSVGLFTEGLSSFVGESVQDDDETASATLELAVSGVALRPVVLFNGLTDLMRLIFSGATSEPSVAFEGTYVILDVTEDLVLQSGFPVRFSMEGIVSNVLSSSTEISLWSRNSQSVTTNKLALMVKGMATVKTDFAVVEDELLLRGEFELNFFSDVDFYESPYQLCVQMTHPEFILKTEEKYSTTVPGHQARRRKLRRRKWIFPARSYSLHRKNNEMCASLIEKND